MRITELTATNHQEALADAHTALHQLRLQHTAAEAAAEQRVRAAEITAADLRRELTALQQRAEEIEQRSSEAAIKGATAAAAASAAANDANARAQATVCELREEVQALRAQICDEAARADEQQSSALAAAGEAEAMARQDAHTLRVRCAELAASLQKLQSSSPRSPTPASPSPVSTPANARASTAITPTNAVPSSGSATERSLEGSPRHVAARDSHEVEEENRRLRAEVKDLWRKVEEESSRVRTAMEREFKHSDGDSAVLSEKLQDLSAKLKSAQGHSAALEEALRAERAIASQLRAQRKGLASRAEAAGVCEPMALEVESVEGDQGAVGGKHALARATVRIQVLEEENARLRQVLSAARSQAQQLTGIEFEAVEARAEAGSLRDENVQLSRQLESARSRLRVCEHLFERDLDA